MPVDPPRIAVLGAGSWGTTLGIVLSRLGRRVALWDHDADRAATVQRERENRRHVPGIPFPESLSATGDLAAALRGAPVVVLAVPAQTVREVATRLAPHLGAESIVVIAAKGLEIGTGLRMSEVVAASLPDACRRIAVLSGPNLAGEIVRESPAASVVASADAETARAAREALSTPRFRLYASADIVGVELGGALKNVMALAAGLTDGLGYGDNSKASLITRGLAEIARLGVATGAHAATFAGLSGLGDLVATCASPLSRNHRVGYELGRGKTLAAIQAAMSSVAEGVSTTKAACALADRYAIEMPIVDKVHAVLFDGKDPHDAVDELLARAARDELTGEVL